VRPIQFPDKNLINGEIGMPNSRFQALKLLKYNFGPCDQLVSKNPAFYT